MELFKDEKIKDIKGYEGKYAITTYGRIYSYRSKRFLKPTLNKRKNYPRYYINLGRGCENRFYIHRLVAETFIPNPFNKKEVDHIDTNSLNNNVNNLRWVDRIENMSNEKTKEKISKNGGAYLEIEYIPTGEKFIGIENGAKSKNVSKTTVLKHLKHKVKNPKWKYTGKKINYKDLNNLKN